jgi:sulfite reductase (NADPH) hemoprotein beta-component
MNACGHHHVGHVGILGVDKKGEEFYQISIGGDATADAALGTILGPSVARAEVPDVLEDLLELYRARRAPGERFIDCVRRIGVEPFREHLHGRTDR